MKIKIIVVLFLFAFVAKGQGSFDPYFYNYLLNTYLKNPGYIGISEHPTGTFVTHTEPSSSYLFGFSYQQNMDDIKGALGVSYYYHHTEVPALGTSNMHNINFQYSPLIKLSKDISFKPGIDLGAVFQRTKIPGLPYPLNGDISATYFNATGGVVLFGKDFHAGFSFGEKGIGNSVSTNIPWYSTSQQSSFTVDFAFNINSHDREKTWSLTPNIFFLQNEKDGLTIAGLTFHYLPLLIGFNIETDNVGNFLYIPMVGMWDKYFRISFSYQHLTAKPPKVNADDFLELMVALAMPSNSGSNAKKFSRMF